MKIKIGSRASRLAIIQSELVKAKLVEYDQSLDIEIIPFMTKGDKILDIPLDKIGDKGLFTNEIEKALLNGEIDIAVHSLKDLPSNLLDGLTLASAIKAASSNDCLILKDCYANIEDLPFGALIASGSKRRKECLKRYRKDLNFVDIRGNIETRIKKFKELGYDGLVIAKAALERLEINDLNIIDLSYDFMIPACGQGILAIELKENSPLLSLFEKIKDPISNQRMHYERLFLKNLEGDCKKPIGCHAEISSSGIDFWALYGEDDRCFFKFEKINKDIEKRIIEIANELKKEVKGE